MCYSSSPGNHTDPIHLLQIEVNGLRAEVGYWRTLHVKALERCEVLQKKIDQLKARIKWLSQKLFGKSSEKPKGGSQKNKDGTKKPKKSKGKQPGSQGFGRTPMGQLPVIDEIHELPEDKVCCSHCKKPFAPLPGTEDSEEVEIEIKAHRRRIRRKCYKPTCKCPENPGVITAPVPPKLIPKGKFGISVWVLALLSKYFWQRPTHRLLHELAAYGLAISQGTITGGFKKLAPLIAAAAGLIEERNRSEHHWHADETRWMVFVETPGKKGHRWYLWVFQSATTVCFKLVPSRGAQVAKDHFGEEAWGIISADRYSSYKALIKTGRFLIAFCWAHVRRDFIDLVKMWPKQESWAFIWVERVGNLYHLNEARLPLVLGTKEYQTADQALRDAIRQMENDASAELSQPTLHPASKKVLESLQKHWSGLTLFVRYPWIPMDNNTAERTLRNPVTGRKGYYGSGALWSAQLNADMLSVTSTLALWGINPKLWFTEYFEACAKSGGNVPDSLGSFMPWNLSVRQLKAFEADPELCPKQKPEFKMEEAKCATVEKNSPPSRSRPSISSLPTTHKPIGGFYRKRSVKYSAGVNPMVI